MTNVYYLSDFKQPKEPDQCAKSAEHDDRKARRELQQRLLAEAQAARDSAWDVRKRLRPPPPEENKLEAATPVLLYHTSWGRNAWHSTWISRYTRNTLEHSHEAAKASIAGRLTQGSAFRLTVMPGWHLQFDRRAYLVCEINSNWPFMRLRAARFAAPGVMEAEALRMLDPRSDLWRGSKPLHDSVIVQETKRPASDFVMWADRTDHPKQTRTPGRYQRKIDGRHWWFTPANGDDPVSYNTSAFEALIVGIHEVATGQDAEGAI